MGRPSLRVLLTFDLEEWEGKYRIYEANLTGKTRRLLDLLEARDLPATFFLDGLTVQRYPETAKMLQSKRFELALHSDYHYGAVRMPEQRRRPVVANIPDFRQDSRTQEERMRRAVSMIREVLPGFEPKGFRAPGLRWNEALYVTLPRLGFVYDSSQMREVFWPFTKNGVVVIPMNSLEYDSACYKAKPQYVLSVWRERFKRAVEAAESWGEAYFLLLAHPSVSGKSRYIGILKAILNHVSSGDVEYCTCLDLAERYLRGIGSQGAG